VVGVAMFVSVIGFKRLSVMTTPFLSLFSIIQWVLGTVSLAVKWPGREADDLLPSSAKVKNVWNYKSTPQLCVHGMVLH
jgi:hypothetical protein